MLNHVVRKQFGDDTILKADALKKRMPGECVDAFSWSNLQSMLKHNFVSELSERADPVPDSEGRWWMDETALLRNDRIPMETDAEPAGDEGTPPPPAPPPPSEPSTPRTAEAPASPLPEEVTEPSYKPKMTSPGRWTLSDSSIVVGNKADAWAEQIKLEAETG